MLGSVFHFRFSLFVFLVEIIPKELLPSRPRPTRLQTGNGLCRSRLPSRVYDQPCRHRGRPKVKDRPRGKHAKRERDPTLTSTDNVVGSVWISKDSRTELPRCPSMATGNKAVICNSQEITAMTSAFHSFSHLVELTFCLRRDDQRMVLAIIELFFVSGFLTVCSGFPSLKEQLICVIMMHGKEVLPRLCRNRLKS